MLTHNSQLETMVFISGLLLGYQAMQRTEALNFRFCVLKKIKRLLLPCFLFGIVYYVLFYDLSASPISIIYRILNGCGHLWFLPMIFWCFVFTFIIIIKLPPPIHYGILTFSLLAVLNPLGFLPLGLGSVWSYFLFFYLGFCIKQQFIKLPLFSKRNSLLAVSIFVISFVGFMLIREYWPADNVF